MDIARTHCPYCKPPHDGKYAWRIVGVDSISDGINPVETIKAIEIYCTKCLSTLSITVLPAK